LESYWAVILSLIYAPFSVLLVKGLDSDGNINEIVPLWLKAGVNGFFPLEVAAGMDAVKLRKKYGKNIILVGNIDNENFAVKKKLKKCTKKFLLVFHKVDIFRL